MSIPLTTAFILILVNGLVYLFWKFRKGKENIPQPIDMRNREPVNIPVPIGELNILNEDHYDEISSDIGSTYYHSVEWLNTTIDSDTDNSILKEQVQTLKLLIMFMKDLTFCSLNHYISILIVQT